MTESEKLAKLSKPSGYDAAFGPNAEKTLSRNDLVRLEWLSNLAMSNHPDRVAAFDAIMTSRKGRLLVYSMAKTMLDQGTIDHREGTC